MARAITKIGNKSIAYLYIVDNMEKEQTTKIEGEEIIFTDKIELRGRKSENACMIAAEKQFQTKNLMVTKVTYEADAKLTLSADAFFNHSNECVDGVSYGHEFVTAQFKVTNINVMYRNESGMHNAILTYNGETTDSKLLTYARDYTKSKMCVVKSKSVETTTRFMLKTEYETLARRQMGITE